MSTLAKLVALGCVIEFSPLAESIALVVGSDVMRVSILDRGVLTLFTARPSELDAKLREYLRDRKS